MTWYIDSGPDSDVVISSRVRLARNLCDYPFPHMLNATTSSQVTDEITRALNIYGKMINDEFVNVNMDDLSDEDKQSLVEKHLISEDLTKGGIIRKALIRKDESISVMINEEDHIRIQSMEAGLNLEKAYEKSQEIAIYLEKNLHIGFNRKFGFTTSCPTNIGTGMRASVMMHLPALMMLGKISTIIENIQKMGYSVRGYYGENSNALGNIYQISNQITLGLNEEELISDIKKLIWQIMEQERAIRKQLYEKNPLYIEDKVYRALGILQNARILTNQEAVKLISDVRLGVAIGIIGNVDEKSFNKVMVSIGPASIQKVEGRIMEPIERDQARAKFIREALKDGE
ncbi:MAG: protein arginine kinase [Saccharofermentanales bacterium]